MNRYVYDEHLFAAIAERPADDLASLDHYLAELPEGRHAGEVLALRDDRRFERARASATQKGSPSFLREYLADASNTRHRQEAQKLINGFYDAAIARLRGLAEGKKVDQEMFDALLALLEALKTMDRPVVTVGFHGVQEPTPNTEKAKKLEELVYSLRLAGAEKEDLEKIEKDLGGSAILPLGQTFDPEQVARRERIILEHLRSSLAKVLDADILTLTAAVAGEKPILEVGYHIKPSGSLYLYTSTHTTLNGWGGLVSERKEVVGLLRGYEIGWTITFRPPGAAKEHVCRLGSEPATELRYDSNDSDPSWVPYAVILHSAFHDMPCRIIRNFALEPPPAPPSWDARTVLGQ